MLRGFLLTSSPSLFTLNFKSAFSLQGSFGRKSSWAGIWSHLLCLCVICMGNCPWFTDGKLWFTDDEETLQNAPCSSTAKFMLPGNTKCSMTSLADTKHIFRERKIYLFLKPRMSQLAKTTRGWQTARALRARQDYKVSTVGKKVKANASWQPKDRLLLNCPIFCFHNTILRLGPQKAIINCYK